MWYLGNSAKQDVQKEDLINSFKCHRGIKVRGEIYPLNLNRKTVVTLRRDVSMVKKLGYSRKEIKWIRTSGFSPPLSKT